MKLTGEAKFLLAIIIGTVAVLAASFVVFSKPTPPAPTVSRQTLIPPGTYTVGNASASAYLVEFSDFQCPACAAFEPTVEEVVNKYGDRMQFAYRNFPLDQHPLAIPAAMTAGAAAKQGKFWEMHNLLFANQDRFSDTLWEELAKKISLNTEQFNADLKNPEIKKHIQDDRADGIKLGVNATPTFFLNGVQLTLNSPADLLTAVQNTVK